MAVTVTFVFLLWCCCFWSIRSFVEFSSEIQVIVEYDVNNGTVYLQNETTDHPPLVQIFSLDRSSSSWGRILVCVLSRLTSPEADILWWINNTLVNSTDANSSWSRHGGGYSATCLWAVEDWSHSASYWCGTEQEGQVYKQRLCD